MTKYQELALKLHEMIRGLGADGKFPSVRTLMSTFNASQVTVEHNLGELLKRGEVVRQKGVGYFRSSWGGGPRIRIVLCVRHPLRFTPKTLFISMLQELMMNEACCHYDIHIMDFEDAGDMEKFKRKINVLAPSRCILLGFSHPDIMLALKEMEIRSIQLFPNYIPDNAPTALIDNEQAVRLLFDHLASLGHRRIAMIHGQDVDGDFFLDQEERMNAFYCEMQNRGYFLGLRSMVFGGFDTASGYKAGRRLLDCAPELRPTAIIANDFNAAGVYQAAAELGLSIPEEISIVGTGDQPPYGQSLAPCLTSIDVEWKTGIGQIVELINGNVATENRIQRLPVKLIQRGSTGPPHTKNYQRIFPVELFSKNSQIIKTHKKESLQMKKSFTLIELLVV